ncbi:hypothetical protein SAMN05428949_4160 [Chitinophaga sp. YR627]|uniref:hypothetical protein n=1 Tax=Chitinophaga sp. YR627 TaxID=1881041 RepID=UPI0008E435EE|nr:hypothetical protein [Chitinophaga sp. YR627]SFO02204.1 hypothetical protein SAMN05428949_4160 [Chitinophaga sp. YR627]
MEIISQKTYAWLFFFELGGYSLLLPILSVFIRGDAWILLILLFLIILIVRFRRTYTRSLRIDGPQLEVTYIKYFIRQTRRFTMTDTIMVLRDFYDIEMKSKYTSHQIWFSRIEIIENNKVKQIFSTKDGYEKETILAFFDTFTKEKNKLLSASH